jgi:hypothetical protein
LLRRNNLAAVWIFAGLLMPLQNIQGESGPFGERRWTLPLNNPPVVRASESGHMKEEDMVAGILVRGEARAYPWWILKNYHLVNDTVQEEPVFMTLCEACSGSGAFYARLDGYLMDFLHDPAGPYYGSFSVLDSRTRSRWVPFGGTAFAGPLKGRKLTRLPVYQTTWGEWVQQHPETWVVLGSEEQRMRSHGIFQFIGKSDGAGVFQRSLRVTDDDRLPEGELVFGIFRSETRAKAYPLKRIQESGGVVQERFHGLPILLFVRDTYRVGAFSCRRQNRELQLTLISKEPLLFKDQDGTVWDEWGRGLSGPSQGGSLDPADGYLTEWFEWINKFPGSEIWAGTAD